MQPSRPRCGLCGARLMGTDDAMSWRDIARLSGLLVLVLGGFVGVGVGILSVLLWLMR